MIKRILISLCWLACTFAGVSQSFSPEVWHNGQVITSDNDTLLGKLKYSFTDDVVILKTPRTIQTFNIKKIKKVAFTDSISRNTRVLKPFMYETSPDYKIPVLFEVMNEGELSLLTRDFIETYTTSSSFNDGFLNTFQEHVVYMYYIDKSEILALPGKKKQFLKLFGRYHSQIESYMKENSLRVYSRMDVRDIFNYYNTISK